MQILLMLLAIAFLAWILAKAPGPFGLLDLGRTMLMKIPGLGGEIVKALLCNSCMGFWSSALVYFVSNNGGTGMNLGSAFTWVLGGAAFASLFLSVLDKLNIDPFESKE